MLKLSDEAMKIMMYLQRNWWKLFFSEIVALESIPAFLLKRILPQIFSAWVPQDNNF